MIVFRVENENGKGFYQDGFYGKFRPVHHWYPILKRCSPDAMNYFINTIHPKVSQEYHDMVYNLNSNFVFGFSSEIEMKLWFPESILNSIILKNGKITKYEVNEKHVKILNKQCIFDISEAKILN